MLFMQEDCKEMFEEDFNAGVVTSCRRRPGWPAKRHTCIARLVEINTCCDRSINFIVQRRFSERHVGIITTIIILPSIFVGQVTKLERQHVQTSTKLAIDLSDHLLQPAFVPRRIGRLRDRLWSSRGSCLPDIDTCGVISFDGYDERHSTHRRNSRFRCSLI